MFFPPRSESEDEDEDDDEDDEEEERERRPRDDDPGGGITLLGFSVSRFPGFSASRLLGFPVSSHFNDSAKISNPSTLSTTTFGIC